MGNFTSIVANPDGAEVTYRWPGCKIVSQLREIFSYIVTILVWICAFNSLGLSTSVVVGVYLLLFAIPLTALEFSKVFMSCCTMCKEDSRFCKFWHFMLRLDGWKRGVFYIVVSIPLFILCMSSLVVVFGIIVSFLLTFLGLLYIATKFTVITINIPPPTNFAQAGTPTAYGGSLPPAGGPRDPNQFSTIP